MVLFSQKSVLRRDFLRGQRILKNKSISRKLVLRHLAERYPFHVQKLDNFLQVEYVIPISAPEIVIMNFNSGIRAMTPNF